MKNETRYFAVTLLKGGKLQLTYFYSNKERKAYCDKRENLTRPITWKQWMQIPKDMKY